MGFGSEEWSFPLHTHLLWKSLRYKKIMFELKSEKKEMSFLMSCFFMCGNYVEHNDEEDSLRVWQSK